MSWLQSVERLNRTPATELTDARRQRRQLLADARAVATYTVAPGTPDGFAPGTGHLGCPARRCAFHGVADGAALCALVHRLGDVAAPLDTGPAPLVDVEDLVRRFLSALGGSIDAVRYCRLMEHPAGRCWFVADGESPGCGEVLRLAHLVA